MNQYWLEKLNIPVISIWSFFSLSYLHIHHWYPYLSVLKQIIVVFLPKGFWDFYCSILAFFCFTSFLEVDEWWIKLLLHILQSKLTPFLLDSNKVSGTFNRVVQRIHGKDLMDKIATGSRRSTMCKRDSMATYCPGENEL